MKSRGNTLVIVLVVILVLIVGYFFISRDGTQSTNGTSTTSTSTGSSDEIVAGGTYIAYLPTSSTEGRTVTLYLSDTESRTATLVHDFQSTAANRVEIGTWSQDDNVISLKIASRDTPASIHVLVFTVASKDKLILVAPEASWGTDGLTLVRSLISLDTNWKWQETNVAPLPQKKPVAGKNPFILKLAADGSATLATDCNTYGGTFGLRDTARIGISLTTSTKMFCEGSQETDVVKDINSAVSYDVDGDYLMMALPNNAGTMVFIRERAAD